MNENIKKETESHQDSTAADSRSEQEIVRAEKLKKLAESGADIFPHKIEKSHSISEIVDGYSEKAPDELENSDARVDVPGRILSVRKMGRATFFHISDGAKKVQVYIRADKIGQEAYDRFSLFDIGDMVSVSGSLFKTRTGELSILADSVRFLAKCLRPLPEKWHGLQDVEIRYRQRYLDLIVNPEAAEVFRTRSAIIAFIRRFFDDRGYIEVETPMMQTIPGGALARPFKTFHNALGIDLFLRIAPELYLKRLVVGGFEKVYEINRNFRNEGISTEHNPEFTMLEFYEAYIDYNRVMEITEEIISGVAENILGKDEIEYGENRISLKRPWRKIRFKDALSQFGGIGSEKIDNRDEVIALASDLSGDEGSLSYGNALDVLFDKYVKPQLVQPTFIINPPKEISPLAKASPDRPEEAERFELFISGMEIANGFSELTDPAEQKMRFEQQVEERKKGDQESHLYDEDYIQALEYGLPPTGGDGIGIDRLVMLMTNRRSIREVILFPLLRPKQDGS